MKTLVALSLVFLATATALFAQVTASPISEKQAKQLEAPKKGSEGLTEMKSPMLLELKVPSVDFASAAVAKVNPRFWGTTGTSKYVCDKAVVKSVEIRDTLHRRGRATIEVKTEVGSKWFRQDIDLTVALLAADGHEVGKKTWRSLTIGNDWGSLLTFGSHTKTPTLKIKMAQSNFLKLFANGQNPKIQVILDIKGDEEKK